MRRMMVRYKLKPDRVQENQAYVQKVFADLKRSQPAGLRYASFVGSDGVTMFHIVSVETTDGDNPLTHSPAFQAFTAGVHDRCEEPPVSIALDEIGSYHFFEK